MKWFLMLIILALSAGAIELDTNLTKHNIYASDSIIVSNGSSTTPIAGIIGTNGVFEVLNDIDIRSNAYMNNIVLKSNAEINISNDTLFYNTVNVWPNITGTSVIKNPVYDEVPILPTLTPIPISNPPDLNINGGTIYELEPGIHYFNNVSLGGSAILQILSGTDIEIHIAGTLTMDGTSQILSDPASTVIIQHNGNQLNIGSDTKIIATIVAPESTIKFNNNVLINGQVFCKVIRLQGFSGEGFVFIDINKTTPNVIDQSFVCNEHETIIYDILIENK